jgi:hypothetical protein
VLERPSGWDETSSVGGAREGGSANNLDWRRRLAAGDSLVVAISTDTVDESVGSASIRLEMKLQNAARQLQLEPRPGRDSGLAIRMYLTRVLVSVDFTQYYMKSSEVSNVYAPPACNDLTVSTTHSLSDLYSNPKTWMERLLSYL